MAKYIIDDIKTEGFEKNFKLPFVNLIPAFVWSIPFRQRLFPDADFWMTFGLCALFVIVYVTLSFLPIITVVPCVAGTIIFTALAWAPADRIGNNVVRIIVKVVILAFFIMLEFCIWINATLPWIVRKFPNTPNIRRVE
ncbi:MAG: hypothetical protein PHX08_03380 [Lachnospiraceae bacterium]|nr:hypothetical protein [Lachnospiraceae bacterium]